MITGKDKEKVRRLVEELEEDLWLFALLPEHMGPVLDAVKMDGKDVTEWPYEYLVRDMDRFGKRHEYLKTLLRK